jgi:NSS family neurotransmitter:Na+ symporter
MSANESSWGSRIGLILAMAGNAVGFGNFLRFPVQAIQNGGGTFIIPYLTCFLLMGIPLLYIEWASGRFGGKYGHHSTPFIIGSMDRRSFWKYIGVFGLFTNLAVAAYYCYLESWTLGWVWHTIQQTFVGQSMEEVGSFFDSYVKADSYEPFIFWIICLFLNTYILSKGLSGGVERAAKIGMPLLIFFGIFLAFKGLSVTAGENGAIHDASLGLNFLWTPDYSSIWDSKVWLAAAGQIFFTLSVGMGSIQCYASFVKKNQDISLNAMSAGWMNEFVEVVIGSCIIIPISVGYLGIDKVIEMTQSGGLGLGFKVLPYLFQQWGDVISVFAGVAWFGLLFFAGITSSLAMGTPVINFLKDEFKFTERGGAWTFGIAVFVLGLPTVLFFNYGVFDEYDHWAGTVSLVIFAMFQTILFGWIFGIDKGWKEITTGADYKPPIVIKYLIKYVTPVMIIVIFVSSFKANILEKITHKAIYEKIDKINEFNTFDKNKKLEKFEAFNTSEKLEKFEKSENLNNLEQSEKIDELLKHNLQFLSDKIFYLNISRIALILLFLGICYLVFIAYRKRLKEGRFINTDEKF